MNDTDRLSLIKPCTKEVIYSSGRFPSFSASIQVPNQMPGSVSLSQSSSVKVVGEVVSVNNQLIGSGQFCCVRWKIKRSPEK